MTDIEILQEEIISLRKKLQLKEEQLLNLKDIEKSKTKTSIEDVSNNLPKWAVERYSRQCLVTDLSSPLKTLRNLMSSSVLIVGTGGLGCPAAGYLTGAGVGHIGLVDYDEVEVTNIHRQLLHSELTVGMSKVESAAIALKRINSNVIISTYNTQLNSENALNIISKFDIVLDATDNVVTRYLLNDACVLAKKPLVSASALKMEGQLTIYNYIDKNSENSGACMRCIFPSPPPPAAVGSCSQQGVMGPVPGVLGTLQALETIKIILGAPTIAGTMVLYDGTDCKFRSIKLRGKNPKCHVCSSEPTITKLIDYTVFCNAQASDKDLNLDVLKDNERINPKDFNENVYKSIVDFVQDNVCDKEKTKKLDIFSIGVGIKKVFLDVRSEGEFDMCNIQGSFNIPFDTLDNQYQKLVKFVYGNHIEEVYFVCRRGNDSQLAVQDFKNKFREIYSNQNLPIVKDIVGGLHGWAKHVDNNFPVY